MVQSLRFSLFLVKKEKPMHLNIIKFDFYVSVYQNTHGISLIKTSYVKIEFLLINY